MATVKDRCEAVVVGTGFGGSITACRLAKRWPGKVLVFERGKRYGLGAFPRTPHAMASNFWNTHLEKRERPRAMSKIEQTGLFDIRHYGNIDVVLGAGLGGGSLIYANVYLEPPEQVFEVGWPQSCNRVFLQPYYAVAKEVLGSRPIPQSGDLRRRIVRTELFQNVARRMNRKSQLVDINVFFGNDFSQPLQQGEQATNRYGALQTSCTYCGECDIGCNYQAKNTLDLNYLFRAESHYGAIVRTEHLVDRISPVNEDSADDPAADGQYGFRVYYQDLSGGRSAAGTASSVLTNRVILSAGSLGSTELLLRSRDVFGSLARIGTMLGAGFSGNGDFLSFVLGTRAAADPNYGPVITQAIDFNLYNEFRRDCAFVMEDASYPALLAWFAEGAKPGALRLGAIWRAVRSTLARVRGRTTGSFGFALQDLLSGDESFNTAVLLCMGLDRSNGTMTLGRDGWLDLFWPTRDSRSLYDAILAAGKLFQHESGSKYFFPLPTWWWPFRQNVTVHPLGGCNLADGPQAGVTSAQPGMFGQVFGYSNLYVADGAIVPTAVGANPTATIAALSERVAEDITGIVPTATL